MIENLFFDGTVKTRKSSATITIPISRLQSKITEWIHTLPITTSQPSPMTLQYIYDEWEGQRKITEITFDELIQSLLQNSHFKAETVAYQPRSPSGLVSPLTLPSQQQHQQSTTGAVTLNSPPLLDQLLLGTMGAPPTATANGQILVGPGRLSATGSLTSTDGNLSLESSQNEAPPSSSLPGIK
jgi:hypothetical protein